MTKEIKRVSFDEFAGNLARFFKQVVEQHEVILVENTDGEEIVVGPGPSAAAESVLTEEEFRIFQSAFGSWADIDTDSLKEAIAESRKSSRPPVNL